jgi:hypothetical protein
VIAKLFELQGRVTGILFEKLEVLAGQLLNFFRERVESLPELRRRSMHLKFSQLPLLVRCLGFFPQEVQLARGGIPLNLSIPILPISFGNPLSEPGKVFTRQGGDFGLNCFNLGHVRSVRKPLPTGAFTTFIQPRSAITSQASFLGFRPRRW